MDSRTKLLFLLTHLIMLFTGILIGSIIGGMGD